MNDINTEPPRRLEIGNLLAEMGDPRPGVGLDDNGLPDIDWVEIPAGPFIYGEGENRQTMDLPRFNISRYPVTNSQFQAFIDAGGYQDERWWQDLRKPEPEEPSWKQANRPRETVDWYEAVAFTRWLSAQLGVKSLCPLNSNGKRRLAARTGVFIPGAMSSAPGYANINETWQEKGPYSFAVYLGSGPLSSRRIALSCCRYGGQCLGMVFKRTLMNPEHIAVNQSVKTHVLRGGSWSNNQDGLRSALRNGNSPDLTATATSASVLPRTNPLFFALLPFKFLNFFLFQRPLGRSRFFWGGGEKAH